MVASQPVTTEKEMARRALGHFSRSQEFLRQGNWAGYGEELKKVEPCCEKCNKAVKGPRFSLQIV